jgi:hypothetical protein
MASENIFIEHEKWNRYSHAPSHLEELQRTNNAAAIKLYFTQRPLTACMLKQITDTQLHKTEGHIKSAKMKAIHKEKSKTLRKKSQMS